MFGVELLCTDEVCAEVVEDVGDLDSLDLLVCEGCGATLLITAVWEVTEARPQAREGPIQLVRAGSAELTRAA